MPRSATFSVLAAVLFALAFALYDYSLWNTSATASAMNFVPKTNTYIDVALAAFNTTAIVSIGIIFYKSERSTHAAFGKIVRENLSTIIIALIITFIRSVIDVTAAFLAA